MISDQEQIKEIVRLTIDELLSRELIKKDTYPSVLKKVDSKLCRFFKGESDKAVGYTLRQLSDDTYIDIIFLQYRDGKTLEWIAEYFNKDISTIKRNKKRLIYSIYELLEEVE